MSNDDGKKNSMMLCERGFMEISTIQVLSSHHRRAVTQIDLIFNLLPRGDHEDMMSF